MVGDGAAKNMKTPDQRIGHGESASRGCESRRRGGVLRDEAPGDGAEGHASLEGHKVGPKGSGLHPGRDGELNGHINRGHRAGPCEAGEYERVAATVLDCHARQIEVLPPDVNRSEAGFSVQDVAPPSGVDAIRMDRRHLLRDSLDHWQRDKEAASKSALRRTELMTTAPITRQTGSGFISIRIDPAAGISGACRPMVRGQTTRKRSK